MKYIINKLSFFMALLFSSLHAAPFDDVTEGITSTVGEGVEQATKTFFAFKFFANIKNVFVRWLIIIGIVVLAILLIVFIYKKLFKKKS